MSNENPPRGGFRLGSSALHSGARCAPSDARGSAPKVGPSGAALRNRYHVRAFCLPKFRAKFHNSMSSRNQRAVGSGWGATDRRSAESAEHTDAQRLSVGARWHWPLPFHDGCWAMKVRGWSRAALNNERSIWLRGLRAAAAGGLAMLSLFCSSAKHSSLASRTPDAGSSSGGSGGAALVVGSAGASVSLNVDASAPASMGGASFTGPLAGPFTDFPASPVLDSTDGGGATEPPSNSAELFGPSSQGAATGGPCLIEPEIGSMYPHNWLRPRFSWTTNDTSNHLFELRLHVNNQTNDLVVYTTQ